MNHRRNIVALFALLLTSCALFSLPGDVRPLVLTWDFNDPSENVTAYRIYEVTVSGGATNFAFVVEVPGATNVANITNYTPGRRTYIATAVNSGGESLPSNDVRTTPPGQPPKNFNQQ